MSPVQSAKKPAALRDLAPDTNPFPWIAPAQKEVEEAIGDLPSDRAFVAMLARYRATGGTVRGGDLVRLLEDRRRGDSVSLATLLVAGEIFSFEWRGIVWIPMFQFELSDLSVKPAPRQVLAELVTVFDGWTLAIWFAQPNPWLNDRSPVDLLGSNLSGVLEAARADRFIAAG
ncbi:hypothetical protein ACSFA8_23405 [Variovorax sp. RT4R15]|uniref:hypothetical protein n=1 Tax=Variovorax sp. RT4R15 TaxID=3443737 RepID=UPI003F48DF83